MNNSKDPTRSSEEPEIKKSRFIEDTIEFSREDLLRERNRYLTEEEKRQLNRSEEEIPLNGDYFDREQQAFVPHIENINDLEKPEDYAGLYQQQGKTEIAQETEVQVEAEREAPLSRVKEVGESLSETGRHLLSKAFFKSEEDDENLGETKVIHSLTEWVEKAKNKVEQLGSHEHKEDSSKPETYEHELPANIVTDQHLHDSQVLPILTDELIEQKLDPQASLEEEGPLFEEIEETEQVVEGAVWLTAGSILSRILGAIYVIPWAMWLANEFTTANSLVSIGYKPYSLFLAIATAGFPSAIAKQMAYFHAKNEYEVAHKLFKSSLIVMTLTGVIASAVLFGLAPSLAAASAAVNVQAATLVIRSLVPALLILPIMSLLRGYFQGFHDMKPTAISQMIEQVVRVIYILGAAYMIMKVYTGDASTVAVHTTLAAFMGAAASLAYLGFKYFRNLPQIKERVAQSANKMTIDIKESMILLLKDSVPFILLGSGIIIAQLIDTYTFGPILEGTSTLLKEEIEILYGTLSHDVDKLMMIVISLAVAIATASVPSIASTYRHGKKEASSALIQNILVVFSFVMLPASLGLLAVSDNVYHLFYMEGSPIGPQLLITGAISCIPLGLYTVLSTILQSMNYRRLAVRYLLLGLLVKIVLQWPLVALFQAHGALLATLFAFLVASILMGLELNKHVSFDLKALRTDLTSIFIVSLLMFLFTMLWNKALNHMFDPSGRLLTFFKLIIATGVGVFVYGMSMGLIGRLNILFGDRFRDFQDEIRLIK